MLIDEAMQEVLQYASFPTLISKQSSPLHEQLHGEVTRESFWGYRKMRLQKKN